MQPSDKLGYVVALYSTNGVTYGLYVLRGF